MVNSIAMPWDGKGQRLHFGWFWDRCISSVHWQGVRRSGWFWDLCINSVHWQVVRRSGWIWDPCISSIHWQGVRRSSLFWDPCISSIHWQGVRRSGWFWDPCISSVHWQGVRRSGKMGASFPFPRFWFCRGTRKHSQLQCLSEYSNFDVCQGTVTSMSVRVK